MREHLIPESPVLSAKMSNAAESLSFWRYVAMKELLIHKQFVTRVINGRASHLELGFLSILCTEAFIHDKKESPTSSIDIVHLTIPLS